jgi:hypothetical protein
MQSKAQMRTQADKEQNKKRENQTGSMGESCPLITITAEANSS